MIISKTVDSIDFLEEHKNTLTNVIGLLVVFVACPILILTSIYKGSTAYSISCMIYSATLTFLFLTSTIYHSTQDRYKKRKLKVLDRIAIFAFIAGTYTPFALTCLEGEFGRNIFFSVWSIAILGSLYSIVARKTNRFVLTLTYLSMGWFALFLFEPLTAAISRAGMNLLILGGLVYSIGSLFFIFDKRRNFHMIWHIFVIFGNLIHYLVILLYINP